MHVIWILERKEKRFLPVGQDEQNLVELIENKNQAKMTRYLNFLEVQTSFFSFPFQRFLYDVQDK